MDSGGGQFSSLAAEEITQGDLQKSRLAQRRKSDIRVESAYEEWRPLGAGSHRQAARKQGPQSYNHQELILPTTWAGEGMWSPRWECSPCRHFADFGDPEQETQLSHAGLLTQGN